jgi:hypothetical protein
MNRIYWKIVACVAGFGVAALARFVLLPAQSPNAFETRPGVEPTRSAEEGTGAPKPATSVPAEPAPKETRATPKPVIYRRPLILKRWQVPALLPKTGKEPNYEDYYVREIFINPTGDKVVTLTNKEGVCWDVASGARLQTFHAATKGDPQALFVSPDARVMAIVKQNGKEVALREAATGKLIGKYQPTSGTERPIEKYPPAFTPGSEYFLFCHRENKLDAICALSTRTGAGRVVHVPRDWGRNNYEWKLLAPLPRQGVVVRQVPYAGVFTVELKTGKERQIESIDFEPITKGESHSLKTSPDGRFVTARNKDQLKVFDWRNDRYIMKDKSTPTFRNEWFTPDGERLAVHRKSDTIYIVNGVRYTPPGGWLQLIDIATGTKIGEFIMDDNGLDGLSALAFSRDGRSFVMADTTTHVAVVDFERAFGAAPLPPVFPEGPETLPGG